MPVMVVVVVVCVYTCTRVYMCVSGCVFPTTKHRNRNKCVHTCLYMLVRIHTHTHQTPKLTYTHIRIHTHTPLSRLQQCTPPQCPPLWSETELLLLLCPVSLMPPLRPRRENTCSSTTHTHRQTHTHTQTHTFLLVEDRQAWAGVVRVPDPDGSVGRAGGQALEGGRVGQTPHRVLIARRHHR